MYEDYIKLRETLKDILEGDVDRARIQEVLAETAEPKDEVEFMGKLYLDTCTHRTQLAAVQSLTGNFPGTVTDTDKAEALLRQILESKRL